MPIRPEKAEWWGEIYYVTTSYLISESLHLHISLDWIIFVQEVPIQSNFWICNLQEKVTQNSDALYDQFYILSNHNNWYWEEHFCVCSVRNEILIKEKVEPSRHLWFSTKMSVCSIMSRDIRLNQLRPHALEDSYKLL